MPEDPKPVENQPPSAAPSPLESSGRALLAGLSSLVEEQYQAGGATKYGLSLEWFTGILGEVVEKYSTPEEGVEGVRRLLAGLHAEELVLARACAAGNESAWDTFLLRFRETLYDAAAGIAKDRALARELADELYGELYCSATPDGRRVSRLNSYMGCGSLEGWLRTVLTRSFIDRCRSERRLVSLDQEEEGGSGGAEKLAAPTPDPVVAVDPRLEQATDEALGGLGAEDRYILASCFLHGRTLAEVAAVLGVHESTVSRRIEKITGKLRKEIQRGLMRRGMSHRQAAEALEADVRDLQINVRDRLQENLQEGSSAPSTERKAKIQTSGDS